MLIARFMMVIMLTGLAAGVIVWSAGDLQTVVSSGGEADVRRWFVLAASLLVTLVLIKYIVNGIVRVMRLSLTRFVSRVLPFLLACLLGGLFLFA